MKKHPKYTIKELKELVSEAGLGRCVQSKLIYERIDNEEVKELWKEAREALEKVEKKLNSL